MNNTQLSVEKLVKNQFPDFYKDYGPELLDFIELYYRYLDGKNTTKRFLQNRDIDESLDEFLVYFKNTYMDSIPEEILGNQRFLQKHILDLYRSKGSITGLKILFRLLYNESVEVYIPSYDILKASDGKWNVDKYLEISANDYNESFHGKKIYGLSSGASCVAELYERKSIKGKIINILYISNINGIFQTNELITHNGIPSKEFNLPKIIGSPTNVEVITSSPKFEIGEVLQDDENINEGKGFKAVVEDTYTAIGTIQFKIEDGGDGYSKDAIVNVSKSPNSSGGNADFFVSKLRDTSLFEYNKDKIKDYLNVKLNADDYKFPLRKEQGTDINTNISICLERGFIEVGKIDGITVTNPGNNYDEDVTVSVVDPYTSTRGIVFENSKYGKNAIISGKSISGEGIIQNLKVLSAGLGYYNSAKYVFLKSVDEPNKVATVKLNIKTNGFSEGYYLNNDGFLSSTKYLQDSYFYQEYSYQILSSRPFKKYKKIVKDLVHMSGNELFGKYKFSFDDGINITALDNIKIGKK